MTDGGSYADDDWTDLRPVERAMARRMQLAGATPTAAQWVDVEVGAATAAVVRLRDEGVAATFNAVILHAVADAVGHHPELGAQLDYERWRRRLPIRRRIGVAVASPRGLVVPAIDVPDGDLRSTAEALQRMVAAVRDGAAARELFTGAVFTVTNIGPLGIHGGVPMPSPEQAAILGVSSTRAAPVVRDGAVVAGEICTLTLTIDHRAVDGITAARFLRRVADTVERGGEPE